MKRVTVGRATLLVPDDMGSSITMMVELNGQQVSCCYFEDDVSARAFCEEIVAAGRAMLVILRGEPQEGAQ